MTEKYFACDPTVTDVELFLLQDEKYRNGKDETGKVVGGGWQSGLVTAGAPGVAQVRPAYTQLAPDWKAGRGACKNGFVSWAPAGAPAAPAANPVSPAPSAKGKPVKTPKPKKK
jgi:hypothetical protein